MDFSWVDFGRWILGWVDFRWVGFDRLISSRWFSEGGFQVSAFKIEVENAIFGRDSHAHDAPFSICKVEVHTNHLPKPNTIKDLLIYFCLRVLKWLVAYLFEVCGVLIKFFFGSKKMTFQYSIYLSFKRY